MKDREFVIEKVKELNKLLCYICSKLNNDENVVAYDIDLDETDLRNVGDTFPRKTYQIEITIKDVIK